MGEKAFALKWLDTEDEYEALNPSFIKERILQKMSSQDKGKGIAMEENEDDDDVDAANEERYQVDLLQATMISRLETSLSEGEPSRRAEE